MWISQLLGEYTQSGGNLILKVLGKEFEEQPFFKRVFLNNIGKNPIKNVTVMEYGLFYVVGIVYRQYQSLHF